MGIPGISDNDDAVVRLLKKIAANTGSIEENSGNTVNREINIEGQTADTRVGLLPADSYTVLESANLEASNETGAIVINPGEEKTLAEFEGSGAVFAVGATDFNNVQYYLEVDNTPVGGRTNSPLGTLNDPFSFSDVMGGAIPVESKARYRAYYDPSATGSLELAARMHVEVM